MRDKLNSVTTNTYSMTNSVQTSSELLSPFPSNVKSTDLHKDHQNLKKLLNIEERIEDEDKETLTKSRDNP